VPQPDVSAVQQLAAKRQRVRLMAPEPRAELRRAAWRRVLVTHAALIQPAQPATRPSTAEVRAARTVLSSSLLTRHRLPVAAPPQQPDSWSSGQSFSVRLQRGSWSFVAKCFYCHASMQDEEAAMRFLTKSFSHTEMQLYVRECKAHLHLYPSEHDIIRSAARDKLSDRRYALMAVPQRCLLFAYYAATLGDTLVEPKHRELFQRAYRGGSLQPAGDSARLLVELALHCFCGLQRHHRAGVLLCDIKPANLFISADSPLRPVFGDYGCARMSGPGQPMQLQLAPTDIMGTRFYRAPEAEQASTVHFYTEASDVFSLACSLTDVLCHRMMETTAARRERLGDLHAHAAPPRLVELLLAMLHDDPARRMSLSYAVSSCERTLREMAGARC